jgi:type IV pilus assembly protein PilA
MMPMRPRRTRDDGFTLIELLTVTIIVGILVTVAIPVFINRRQEAWRASVRADLRNAALAFEVVATNGNGQYPVAIPANVATSPDVALTVGPSATAARICLKGDHAGLSDSIYYDSHAGGLTAVAC